MSKKDNFENGLVCYNGFSFLFFKGNSTIDLSLSSKISSAGAYWDSASRFLNSKVENADHFLDLFNYDVKIDLLFAGSLKTLVPSLQFGGYERLFDVIIIVRTPGGKIFPITYYFGPSGTAIGGWDSRENDIINIIFPNESDMITRFNPFELSKSEIKELLNALEGAFRKVHISDFESVYEHDYGKILMGIRSGKPFIIDNYVPEQNINTNKESKHYKIRDVNCLSFSPDGKYIISGLWNGKIHIWDFKTGELVRSLIGHSDIVSRILITSDSKYIISSSWDTTIRVWDFFKGNLMKILKSPKNGAIESLFFMNDEKCIISGFFEEDAERPTAWTEIWELETGNLIKCIEFKIDIFSDFRITPDEKYLVGILKFVDIIIMRLDSEKIIKIFKGHEDYIRCIAITPDGKTIISGSDDGTTRVWDFNTGKEIKKLSGGAENIRITTDAKYIISGIFSHISIRDFDTFEKISTFKVHDAIIYDLQLSPDGKYIIHTAGSLIKIWNFKTFNLLKVIDTK